jgi:hypothetical protein
VDFLFVSCFLGFVVAVYAFRHIRVFIESSTGKITFDMWPSPVKRRGICWL